MKGTDAERYVELLYQGLMHRKPDAEGFGHYVDALNGGADPISIFEVFVASEEFKATRRALYVPSGHFFSPVVDVHDADVQSQMTRAQSSELAQLPGIEIDGDRMLATWRSWRQFIDELPFPDRQVDAFRYYFENIAFGSGDGITLYCMLRWLHPRRVVEVGCGFSSACALDTDERFLGRETRFTFIDPYPQLLDTLIRPEDRTRCQVIATTVQAAPVTTFQELESGDVLFIDSTHVLKTGSDVHYELFEVLPRLAQGVYVHFHDIFWPFEYPALWVLEENRSWNELYALRAYLHRNPDFEIVFFNSYFGHAYRAELAETCPRFLRDSGGSLWLRKKSPPAA